MMNGGSLTFVKFAVFHDAVQRVQRRGALGHEAQGPRVRPVDLVRRVLVHAVPHPSHVFCHVFQRLEQSIINGRLIRNRLGTKWQSFIIIFYQNLPLTLENNFN